MPPASKEFPGEVEAQIPVLVVDSAPSDLTEGRPPAIRGVDLKEMPAGAHLDAEADLGIAGGVASHPRRVFGGEVGTWANAYARPKAEHQRVLITVGEGAGVQDENGLGIDRGPRAEAAGGHETQRTLMLLGEVVPAFEGHDRIQADRTSFALAQQALLPENLDGAIAGAMHTDLRA